MRVARIQNHREDAATTHAPVVIAYTDAFAAGLWHQRYLSYGAPTVDALAPSCTRRFYLLTHHDDVPFTQDGLRDGEHLRAWMIDAFVRSLDQQQRICGISSEQRIARALDLVTKFEAEAWRRLNHTPVTARQACANPRVSNPHTRERLGDAGHCGANRVIVGSYARTSPVVLVISI